MKWGLKPVEMDIWHGFVFVRFKPGPQPPLSQVMAKFEREVAQYDLAALKPDGNGIWTEDVKANWKGVRDVDNEGYHVPMAHPGLHDLFGSNYYDEPSKPGSAGPTRHFARARAALERAQL